MDNISAYFENISILTFAVVFFFGILVSFTPCVYPLIPIIAGVIGATKESSKLKNFFLSLCYVAGLALTFSVLGLVAGLTGRLFGQVQSSPVAHLIVGGIIIVFALSMMGVFPLPVFLLNRAGAGRVTKGGNFVSVFFMGAASGLIAAPCATPALGAVLAYVASTQNAFMGFLLLFTFASGLGLLLVIVGTFSGIIAAMPRSARWLAIVEKAIGILMIVIGCYFIFKAGTLSV